MERLGQNPLGPVKTRCHRLKFQSTHRKKKLEGNFLATGNRPHQLLTYTTTQRPSLAVANYGTIPSFLPSFLSLELCISLSHDFKETIISSRCIAYQPERINRRASNYSSCTFSCDHLTYPRGWTMKLLSSWIRDEGKRGRTKAKVATTVFPRYSFTLCTLCKTLTMVRLKNNESLWKWGQKKKKVALKSSSAPQTMHGLMTISYRGKKFLWYLSRLSEVEANWNDIYIDI